MKKFWMLFVPGANSPRMRHDTLELAQKEARRLITANNADQVVVLEAVELIETQPAPVVVTKIE